jgi:hypothetical protein
VVVFGPEAGIAHHNPGDVGDIREIAALAAMVKGRGGLPLAIALAHWKTGMNRIPIAPASGTPPAGASLATVPRRSQYPIGPLGAGKNHRRILRRIAGRARSERAEHETGSGRRFSAQ